MIEIDFTNNNVLDLTTTKNLSGGHTMVNEINSDGRDDLENKRSEDCNVDQKLNDNFSELNKT